MLARCTLYAFFLGLPPEGGAEVEVGVIIALILSENEVEVEVVHRGERIRNCVEKRTKCRGRAYLSENEVEVEVVHRGRELENVTKMV